MGPSTVLNQAARPSDKTFATIPVAMVAAAVTVGLLSLSQWHGFHRDVVWVCRDRPGTWERIWPQLKHLG